MRSPQRWAPGITSLSHNVHTIYDSFCCNCITVYSHDILNELNGRFYGARLQRQPFSTPCLYSFHPLGLRDLLILCIRSERIVQLIAFPMVHRAGPLCRVSFEINPGRHLSILRAWPKYNGGSDPALRSGLCLSVVMKTVATERVFGVYKVSCRLERFTPLHSSLHTYQQYSCTPMTPTDSSASFVGMPPGTLQSQDNIRSASPLVTETYKATMVCQDGPSVTASRETGIFWRLIKLHV